MKPKKTKLNIPLSPVLSEKNQTMFKSSSQKWFDMGRTASTMYSPPREKHTLCPLLIKSYSDKFMTQYEKDLAKTTARNLNPTLNLSKEQILTIRPLLRCNSDLVLTTNKPKKFIDFSKKRINPNAYKQIFNDQDKFFPSKSPHINNLMNIKYFKNEEGIVKYLKNKYRTNNNPYTDLMEVCNNIGYMKNRIRTIKQFTNYVYPKVINFKTDLVFALKFKKDKYGRLISRNNLNRVDKAVQKNENEGKPPLVLNTSNIFHKNRKFSN